MVRRPLTDPLADRKARMLRDAWSVAIRFEPDNGPDPHFRADRGGVWWDAGLKTAGASMCNLYANTTSQAMMREIFEVMGERDHLGNYRGQTAIWPKYEAPVVRLGVRRQNIWRNSRRRLAESGPRLGFDVRRRACGAASADIRWSFV